MKKSILSLQLIVIAVLAVWLYNTLTSQTTAQHERTMAEERHIPAEESEQAAVADKEKTPAEHRADLSTPERTVPAMMLSNDPAIEQTFLDTYEVTHIDTMDAARTYSRTNDEYQIIYIDPTVLDTIDITWLKYQYEAGKVIVGIDMNIEWFIKVLDLDTIIHPLEPAKGYTIVSTVYKSINTTNNEIVGQGDGNQYYPVPESALDVGVFTHFIRLYE